MRWNFRNWKEIDHLRLVVDSLILRFKCPIEAVAKLILRLMKLIIDGLHWGNVNMQGTQDMLRFSRLNVSQMRCR